MQPSTDFGALFSVARDTLIANGFDDSFAMERVKRSSSEDARSQLLEYLRALETVPLKADPDALSLAAHLREHVEAEKFDGVQIVFENNDPLPEQEVSLELVRDRLLRLELKRLIERLEKAY